MKVEEQFSYEEKVDSFDTAVKRVSNPYLVALDVLLDGTLLSEACVQYDGVEDKYRHLKRIPDERAAIGKNVNFGKAIVKVRHGPGHTLKVVEQKAIYRFQRNECAKSEAHFWTSMSFAQGLLKQWMTETDTKMSSYVVYHCRC